jgi:hypothetical protein
MSLSDIRCSYSLAELVEVAKDKSLSPHSEVVVDYSDHDCRSFIYGELPMQELAIIHTLESLFYKYLNRTGEPLINNEFLPWGNDLAIAHFTIRHDRKSGSVFGVELTDSMLSSAAQTLYEEMKNIRLNIVIEITDHEQELHVVLQA